MSGGSESADREYGDSSEAGQYGLGASWFGAWKISYVVSSREGTPEELSSAMCG